MKRLDLLHEEIESLYETTAVSPQLCEVRNLITVGYLIVKEAQFRKESRGLHYNTDYPQKSPDLTEYRIMTSSSSITRAMILAAGLGTRFKPWTDHHPKALAVVNGKSLLQRNIEYLQSYGIRDSRRERPSFCRTD
jgi:succinate dehydrogenase/fumarate reductase flavoprotein subunit